MRLAKIGRLYKLIKLTKTEISYYSYTLIILGEYQECDGYCEGKNRACDGVCAEGYVPCGNVNITNRCLKEEGEGNGYR